MRRVLSNATKKVRHTLTDVILRVVEAREELRNDTWVCVCVCVYVCVCVGGGGGGGDNYMCCTLQINRVLASKKSKPERMGVAWVAYTLYMYTILTHAQLIQPHPQDTPYSQNR